MTIPTSPYVLDPRVRELATVLMYLGARGLVSDAKTFDRYVPGLSAELKGNTVVVQPSGVLLAEAAIRREGFDPHKIKKDEVTKLLDRLRATPS